MAEIVWTTFALQDVNDFAEYIAKDSEKYAARTVQKIFESVEILQTHIHFGRIVPEFSAENLREIISGNYRIVYTIVDEQKIEILTVHHGKRLLSNNPVFFEE